MKSSKTDTDRSTVIRVVVVEDDKKVQESLKWIINEEEDMICAGAYGLMNAALHAMEEDVPDVVLLDIGLPDLSGIEGVRLIKQRFPNVQVLMVTIHSSDEMIFSALQGGAVGYILKTTSSDKIVSAIRDAYEGGAPMSNEIARRVLQFFSAAVSSIPEEKRSPDMQLSEREVQVLKALVDGLTYKAIASKLFISINTVRFHLQNIYAKLHVATRSEAIVKALKEKIV
jgi:DNA-binding NarL/FixJ family response regulator